MTATDGQFMLACYQVDEAHQGEFLAELEDTERSMRDENLITDTPVLRMRSKGNPEYLLEIIEWTDHSAYESVMDNARIQEHWTRLQSMWKSGGLGVCSLPEGDSPWALLDAIH